MPVSPLFEDSLQMKAPTKRKATEALPKPTAPRTFSRDIINCSEFHQKIKQRQSKPNQKTEPENWSCAANHRSKYFGL